MRRFRFLVVASCIAMLPLAVGSVLSASQEAQPPRALPSQAAEQGTLLAQYCITCHNQELNTAGLTLDTMDVANVSGDVEAWEKVVRKLRARVMPPPGRPRPDEQSYDSLVSYLETSLDHASAGKPDPGRVDAFRRLNRTEYRNAIRDLLALEVDVTSLLPGDDVSQGFDNTSLGGLSPTLLDRYLAAARKISRLAVGAPRPSLVVGDIITVPVGFTQEDHVDGLPFGTRGGTVLHYTFPLDAEYEFQIRLGRTRSGARIAGLTESHELEVTVDGERVKVFTVIPDEGSGPYGGGLNIEEQADARLNVRAPVKAGAREIGVAFLKRPSALIETTRQPFERPHAADYGDQRSQPVVYSVAIVGPYAARGAGDTPSRRRIFVCRPAGPADEVSCAKTILSTLARRAYRRPVTDAEVGVLLTFYNQGRAEGEFEAGIEMALRRLIMSPAFLFRIERDPANLAAQAAYRISELELASRLSFFLWSSIPDDELLDAAIQGQLRKPGVLERQVRRMLADERSQALVSNFAGQWLYLRNLPAITPDQRVYPDFDVNLQQAFRRETELFFESIVREERSVLELLTANYTFVNERLAKHYGIPNVYGSRFRRITLGEDRVRGGLLGQGSLLLVTSYPNRTSPVIRGKWILENILGTPPPPPPANVPPLPEADGIVGKVLSMRERMVQHRRNPVCARCHQVMDPVGLSLEKFDAVGRWRARTGTNHPIIDTSGSLPDGTKFEGAAGLRQALVSRPDLFVTTLAEKLLTYGLGRGVEYYDAPAVRAITREAARSDYRFSSLILAIVNSTPFQMRKAS